MNGGGQQPVQTQTATKDPWSGAVPFLNQAMSSAGGLYGAGTSGSYNPYSGPVNADVHPWITQGQNANMQLASDPNQSAGTNAAQQLGLGQIGGEGITPTLGGAVLTPLLGQVGGTYGDIARNGLGSTGEVQGMFRGAPGALPTQEIQDTYRNIINNSPEQVNNYRNVIAGMNRSDNPYLQQIMDTQNRRIGDAVSSRFAGAGREGSGQYADIMARSMAEAEAPEMAADYEARQGRGMQANAGLGQVFGQQGMAAQGIQNAGQADASTRMQAAQGIQGADQANTAARMAGNQGLGATFGTAADIYGQGLNRAGQWAQMMPQLQKAQYGPGDELMNLGGFYQQRGQQDLNKDIGVYNALQAYPWENLSRFNAIIGGAGALGGSTTGTNTTSVPLGQRLLGGTLAGAGLGSAFGPWGTGLGAAGGALAGGFL